MTTRCFGALWGWKYSFIRSATRVTTVALWPVSVRLISSSDFPSMASARPTRSLTVRMSTAIAPTPIFAPAVGVVVKAMQILIRRPLPAQTLQTRGERKQDEREIAQAARELALLAPCGT